MTSDEHAAAPVQIVSLADHLALVDTISRWQWREWGDQEPPEAEFAWRAQLESRARRDSIPFTLVALLNGAAVGSVTVCTDDLDKAFTDNGPWLSGMLVRPTARNMGVGRQLLIEAERRCRVIGVPEIWLHTDEAQRFYERCGWTTIRPKAAGGSAAVMRRRL